MGFDKYGTDEELRRYVRDVHDHATIVAERVDGFRQMLSDILTVNATLVNQAQNEEIKALSESTYNQNEQVKRISAWAAILFAPTLIGTVYGMNFSNMPGLGGACPVGGPHARGQRPVIRHLQATGLALTKCAMCAHSPTHSEHTDGAGAHEHDLPAELMAEVDELLGPRPKPVRRRGGGPTRETRQAARPSATPPAS